MMISAARTVTAKPAAIVAIVTLFPKRLTAYSDFGSKKLFTAEVIPFICVTVPIPIRPASTPKRAKAFERGFHFLPRPFSM